MHVKALAQVHFSSPQQPASSNGNAFGVEIGNGSRGNKQQVPAARRHSASALAGDVFDELLEQVLRDDSHEVSVGGIIFSSIKEFMDDASRSRGSSVLELPAPVTKSADEADRSGAPASGEPAPTAPTTQVCSHTSISTI